MLNKLSGYDHIGVIESGCEHRIPNTRYNLVSFGLIVFPLSVFEFINVLCCAYITWQCVPQDRTSVFERIPELFYVRHRDKDIAITGCWVLAEWASLMTLSSLIKRRGAKPFIHLNIIVGVKWSFRLSKEYQLRFSINVGTAEAYRIKDTRYNTSCTVL